MEGREALDRGPGTRLKTLPLLPSGPGGFTTRRRPIPGPAPAGGGPDRVPRIISDSRRRNVAARPSARNALPGLPPRWPEGGSQDHPEPRLEPALQLRQPRGVAGPLLHRREALPHLGRRVVELDGALQGRVRVGPAPLGARDEAERVLGIERV